MIERYVGGKFDEGELVYFWWYMLANPEYMELLETYLMLKEYFGTKSKLKFLMRR